MSQGLRAGSPGRPGTASHPVGRATLYQLLSGRVPFAGAALLQKLAAGRELRTDQKHYGLVVVCAVSRDGFWALTAGEDRTIWIHRLPLDDEVKPSTEGKGPN